MAVLSDFILTPRSDISLICITLEKRISDSINWEKKREKKKSERAADPILTWKPNPRPKKLTRSYLHFSTTHWPSKVTNESLWAGHHSPVFIAAKKEPRTAPIEAASFHAPSCSLWILATPPAGICFPPCPLPFLAIHCHRGPPLRRQSATWRSRF